MPARIHSANHIGEYRQQIDDDGLWTAGDLAKARDALVGTDLDKNELRAVHVLVCRPTGLFKSHRKRMGDDLSDFHGDLRSGIRARVSIRSKAPPHAREHV